MKTQNNQNIPSKILSEILAYIVGDANRFLMLNFSDQEIDEFETALVKAHPDYTVGKYQAADIPIRDLVSNSSPCPNVIIVHDLVRGNDADERRVLALLSELDLGHLPDVKLEFTFVKSGGKGAFGASFKSKHDVPFDIQKYKETSKQE